MCLIGVSGGGEGVCPPIVRAAAPIIEMARNNATTSASFCVAKFQQIYDDSKAQSKSYTQFRDLLEVAYNDCFDIRLNRGILTFLRDVAAVVRIAFNSVIASIQKDNVVPPLDCVVEDVRITVNIFISALQAVNGKVVEVNDRYQQ